MENDEKRQEENKGRRKEPRIWLYTEHWIWGSSRSELTIEERSVWIDFLCLGIIGMGKVDITHPTQLAMQLCIPVELLNQSLEKFRKYDKIKIKCEKNQKKTFALIVNWRRYQPEYLHDRPEKPTERKRVAKSKDVMRMSPTDRIEEDRIEEDRREEEEKNSLPLPAIPEKLDFKIQDKLREKRAYIRKLERQYEDKDSLKRSGINEEEFLREITKLQKEYCTIIEDFGD